MALLAYLIFIGVGYFLGRRKGRVVAGVVWAALLGPIGWLVIAIGPNLKDGPSADVETRRTALTLIQVVGIAAIFVVSGHYLVNRLTEASPKTRMQSIHDKLTADAVAQYNIARRQGTPMDVCVQAGFVSAAFLTAQDEPNYGAWKAKEIEDCRAAGLNR